jgi:hypothetical protein
MLALWMGRRAHNPAADPSLCVHGLSSTPARRRRWRRDEGVWEPLPLGRAAAGAGSALDPDAALSLKASLDAARAGLNLECDLHLLYLVTPTRSYDALLTHKDKDKYWKM